MFRGSGGAGGIQVLEEPWVWLGAVPTLVFVAGSSLSPCEASSGWGLGVPALAFLRCRPQLRPKVCPSAGP